MDQTKTAPAVTEEAVFGRLAENPESVSAENARSVIRTLAAWALNAIAIAKGSAPEQEEEEVPLDTPAPAALPAPGVPPVGAPAPDKKAKTPLSPAKDAGDLDGALDKTGVSDAIVDAGKPGADNPDDELPDPDADEDENLEPEPPAALPAKAGKPTPVQKAVLADDATDDEVNAYVGALWNELEQSQQSRERLEAIISKSLMPLVEAQGTLLVEQSAELRALRGEVGSYAGEVGASMDIVKSLAIAATDMAMSPTPQAPGASPSPSPEVVGGAKSADALDPTAPAGRAVPPLHPQGVAVRELAHVLGGDVIEVSKSAPSPAVEVREGMTREQFKDAFYEAVQEPTLAARFDLEPQDWNEAISKSLDAMPEKWVKAAQLIFTGADLDGLSLGADLAAVGVDEE